MKGVFFGASGFVQHQGTLTVQRKHSGYFRTISNLSFFSDNFFSEQSLFMFTLNCTVIFSYPIN